MKINALFVETNGIYFNHPSIEPWDIERNAFNCKNGAPAICHPPCKRWGRYWSGGPSVKVKRLLGDDGGAFAFSLWYVRTFGGVIEHPEASHAFNFYGINKPPKTGGWVKADNFGGYVCCVEQGHYGHKARKATWLYLNKFKPRPLVWGKATGKMRMDMGPHSKDQARRIRQAEGYRPAKRLSSYERLATPLEFRNELIRLLSTPSTEGA